jgi:phosphopantothenoylcysteine decarboxylase
LGVTKSIAAIKSIELADKLSKFGDVRIVATKAGKYFLPQSNYKVYVDEDEWPPQFQLGDDVLHIELRRWASCLVIAPLDANTLAKISNGICDNLLTCIVRAWDWNKKIFLCPAMNTMMWESPFTLPQILCMNMMGAITLNPVEKRLACNDVGMGAMAPLDTIVSKVNQKLRWLFPLDHCNGIPINHHPGAFGFHRKKNWHTGVDLYTKDKEQVFAAEDGTVVKVDYFTGPKVGHQWWEETWGVMIEGASGVINYGEVVPHVKEGDKVKRGDCIAEVKRVLFEDKFRPDIPGHSTSMLHLELYKTGSREFADWHDPQKNPNLLDPTPYLFSAEGNNRNSLSWDNSENKSVG